MISEGETLARIDERTSFLVNEVEVIKQKLDKKYVTREEIDGLRIQIKLIQSVVFGAVGLILLGFAGAILKGVIK